MTPFRSEKNTNWEGAFRVPLIVRWPGKIKAGIGLERDRPAPRLAADVPRHGGRAGHRREAEEGRLQGRSARQFKNHIDGYNLLPYLTGETKEEPAQAFFMYFSDDGDVLGMRYDNWKIVFMEQRVARHDAGLGRAVCPAAIAQGLQPANRSVSNARTSRPTRYYDWFIYHAYFILLRRPQPRQFAADVQGVPAGAEGCELHHRRRAGEDE